LQYEWIVFYNRRTSTKITSWYMNMNDKDTHGSRREFPIGKTDTPPQSAHQFIEIPPLLEIEAPAGYRAVSMSHAMMEYAKPVLEFVEDGMVDDINQVYQIAMMMWNYANELERDGYSDNHDVILTNVSTVLEMNKEEALDFMDIMLERKYYLLPPDIQPDIPRVMFIKKEEHVEIAPFDYSALVMTDTVIPTDKEDTKLKDMLLRMDKNIRYNTDYDKWEKSYLKLEDTCGERFKLWLKLKGLGNFLEDFPYYAEIYMNFIYRYGHRDRITLLTITPVYIKEFLSEYVLIKVLLEPTEYVAFPPSMKTFYTFLSEIGYIDTLTHIVEVIDVFEPEYLEVLKDWF
ncbi:hypothetical protein ACFL6P_09745, partial [Candidatus Latescibacterota bacterium]